MLEDHSIQLLFVLYKNSQLVIIIARFFKGYATSFCWGKKVFLNFFYCMKNI